MFHLFFYYKNGNKLKTTNLYRKDRKNDGWSKSVVLKSNQFMREKEKNVSMVPHVGR